MRLSKCSDCKCEQNKENSRLRSNRDNQYCSKCRRCESIYITKRNRTAKGLITRIYSNQKLSCRQRGHGEPKYTLSELREYLLNNDTYMFLHSRWVDSGYEFLMSPSIDRLDNSKTYSFDNIQVVTARENWNNNYKSRK